MVNNPLSRLKYVSWGVPEPWGPRLTSHIIASSLDRLDRVDRDEADLH